MSKVQIKGNASGTGIFTIAAPNTNTDYSITLPTSSATLATTSSPTIASPTFTGDVTFDTSTLVIDSTNNRVGIGTDSPDRPVHLKSSGIRNYFKSETTGSTNGSESGFEIKTPSTNWLMLGLGGTDALQFYDLGNIATRMVINSSGNVGIGTTSPSEKLHVYGNIHVGTGISGDYNRISFERSGGANVGAIGWHNPSDGNSFYIGGHPSFGPTAGNRVRVYGFGSDLALGDNSNGDVLTVKYSNGNVGIGTDSPGTPLDVYRTGSGDAIRFGKENVYGKLVVDGERVGFNAVRSSDSSYYGYYIENPSSSGTSNFEQLALKTNNTTRLIIKENGAIGGPGVTSPNWPRGVDLYHILDCASDGSTDDFADLITSRGITQIGRKIFASFYIAFPNGEANKAYRFYFGNGDGYCNIYAQFKISGTYSYGNSMGYRIYEIVRMANSGTAIYQTRNDDLHSNGSILSHIESNGWGFHSASNRHYIELRHLQTGGNPYHVDFEFYGMTDRSHVLNMQVQKVGY